MKNNNVPKHPAAPKPSQHSPKPSSKRSVSPTSIKIPTPPPPQSNGNKE